MKQRVGVILAGGQSRRFGSPKAFAEAEGKPFYQFSLDVLKPLTDGVVIVTNEKLESKFSGTSGIELITDEESYAGKGPLAGLFSAMQHVKGDWYVTAPVDVPFIQSDIYKKLFEYANEENEIIMPVTNGKLQPLIAVYHYRLKPRIKELLESDRLAMRELFQDAKVKYVDFTEGVPFTNINRKDDYDRYIKNRG